SRDQGQSPLQLGGSGVKTVLDISEPAARMSDLTPNDPSGCFGSARPRGLQQFLPFHIDGAGLGRGALDEADQCFLGVLSQIQLANLPRQQYSRSRDFAAQPGSGAGLSLPDDELLAELCQPKCGVFNVVQPGECLVKAVLYAVFGDLLGVPEIDDITDMNVSGTELAADLHQLLNTDRGPRNHL